MTHWHDSLSIDSLSIRYPSIGNWNLFWLWQSTGYLNYSPGWWNIPRLRHGHRDTTGLEDWLLGWNAISSCLPLVQGLANRDIAAKQVRTFGSCFTRKLVATWKFVRWIVTMVDSYTTSEPIVKWVNLVMWVRPPTPFAEAYQAQPAELVRYFIQQNPKLSNGTYWKGTRCRT